MTQETKVNVENEFKVCSKCNYSGGFHVIFEKIAGAANNFAIKLLCPNCHAVYDIGLKTILQQ